MKLLDIAGGNGRIKLLDIVMGNGKMKCLIPTRENSN
jgi:hypothetical protein